MSRVETNKTNLNAAVETSLGTPGTTWHQLEPNGYPTFGPEITTVPRAPISKNRQRRKGEVVDLASAPEIEMDLTMEHLVYFLPGFMFAKYNGPGNLTDGDVYRPTAVTATGYTVASGGALAQNTLIYARGFPAAANNGLKVVGAASTGTEIKTSGLVVDAAVLDAENATVEVAGVQGASADIVMTAGGNLTSTVLDFTTLGLTVGQWIKIGGSSAATQFATAANNGYARVTVIATNQLTLDRRSATFVSDAGAGKTIQLLFGRFSRNVAVDNADYLARSYNLELTYPQLAAGPVDAYHYAAGNYANEMAVNLAVADKATMTVGFVGTDTPTPTTSRASGASAARVPIQTEPFNCVSDIGRLRIAKVDETGISTAIKSASLTLRNNITPEKILGTLGAWQLNTGLFEVDLEATMVFDSTDVVDAVRNNTTVSLDMLLKNGDGGFYVDIPSMVIGGGQPEFPINESVNITGQCGAFQDTTYAYSVSFSIFPFLP